MANISDVSRRAGVSTATVSRYLRGLPVKSGESIKMAIEELGYHPSSVAQGLRSGVHYAVAVVVPDITNPFFAAVVKGVESICREGPYQVILLNTDESSRVEDQVLMDIVRRVDGIILTPAMESTFGTERLRWYRDLKTPLVLVDREISGQKFDCVLVDNRRGAVLAAEHLLALGHQRIATIRGTMTTTPGRERFEGFRDRLLDEGIDLPPEYRRDGEFRESGGYQAMLQLASLPNHPTAVFSANNLMTAGALKALRDLRIKVPEKISVIGFDDLQLGELLAAPLTCVTRDAVRQGAIAARMLLSQLERTHGQDAQKIVLDVSLLKRASCQRVQDSGATNAAIERSV